MSIVVMRFDFRCPPGNATPAEELYRAALEMAAYADGRGVDVLGLSEHHSTEDGYLSAPLTVATAMAACTRRAMISIAALLVPLYDPIKLAEDLAVLDIIARGRLMVIAGIGYREQEYHALGRDWARRACNCPFFPASTTTPWWTPTTRNVAVGLTPVALSCCPIIPPRRISPRMLRRAGGR